MDQESEIGHAPCPSVVGLVKCLIFQVFTRSVDGYCQKKVSHGVGAKTICQDWLELAETSPEPVFTNAVHAGLEYRIR